MSDRPVSLNQFRKEKARAKARKQADRNAVAYGRTKAEKDLDRARETKRLKGLDQHQKDEE